MVWAVEDAGPYNASLSNPVGRGLDPAAKICTCFVGLFVMQTATGTGPAAIWQEREMEMRKMTRVIARLIHWVKAHGYSAAAITDCTEYITGR